MKTRKWLILSLSILFIILTVLVKMNLVNNIDSYIYDLVTLVINDCLINVYKVITFFGSSEFIIFLCVFFLGLFLVLKKKNVGLIISGVLIISTFVNTVLKLLIRRVRPLVISFVNEDSFSYPSGHTMAAVSMYGILMYLVIKSNLSKRKKVIISIILGLLPILVGVSRVYLGAHFISDVVGAFIVSIILLLIETYYIDKKKLI